MPGTSGRRPATSTNTASNWSQAAAADGLEPLVAIIDRLRDRLRPSVWTYLRTRIHVRGRRAVRHVGRDVLGRALYGLQEAAAADWRKFASARATRPACHEDIRAQVVRLLRPGDVLVVRKEFAATQLFFARPLAARGVVSGHGQRLCIR